MSDIEAKYFVRAVLRFLQQQITDREFSADIIESLEVATQCLETAYDLPSSAAVQENESAIALDETHPLSNIDVFELFRNSCIEVSPERKLEADNIKNEGNCLMKNEKYQEALNAYNRAISLDATNPVFYCNRAAAYSRMGDYQRAADDSKMSLRYDPSYSKAYGRLGIAYSKLNKHKLALEAYQNALRLDPDNVDYQNNMSVTQQRLEEATNNATQSNATPNAGVPPGLPPLVLIENTLNNPEIINMAQRLLTDPAMQEMVTTFQSRNNMDSIMETGRHLVTILRNENPDIFMGVQQQMNNLARTNPDGDTNPPDNKNNQQQQPQPPPPPQQ